MILKLANQKELDEATYNDYQIATERMRRKIEALQGTVITSVDTSDLVVRNNDTFSMHWSYEF
jgi:hypothetical protein